MKRLSSRLFVSAALSLALAAPSFGAYFVTVNTSTLNGTSGFIEFGFGGGDDALTATISQFNPTAGLGAVDGSSFGAFSGDLTTGNSLVLGTANADYFRAFTFGNTIQFLLTLSGPAISSPNPAALNGNSFGLSLYDATGSVALLVSDPINNPFLLRIDIAPGTGIADISSGASSRDTVSVGETVPEPSVLALCGAGLAALAFLRRKRPSNVR